MVYEPDILGFRVLGIDLRTLEHLLRHFVVSAKKYSFHVGVCEEATERLNCIERNRGR